MLRKQFLCRVHGAKKGYTMDKMKKTFTKLDIIYYRAPKMPSLTTRRMQSSSFPREKLYRWCRKCTSIVLVLRINIRIREHEEDTREPCSTG
uniref:Uncharacterized protein n=1 Tax=Arundo donax TaxID=35708 RepID=A0A0A9DDZ7_ARUDO